MDFVDAPKWLPLILKSVYSSFSSHKKATKISPSFSLVEVVMAIAIVTTFLVAIFALLPTALSSIRDGRLEERATDILNLAAEDMRSTSPTSSTSPLFKIIVFSPNPSQQEIYFSLDGVRLTSSSGAVFLLTITPHSDANTFDGIIPWHLAVTWPVGAAQPRGRVETVVALRTRLP